jgi:hypothetical protein
MKSRIMLLYLLVYEIIGFGSGPGKQFRHLLLLFFEQIIIFCYLFIFANLQSN